METMLREQINGFGKRLSEVELLKPTVRRNEEDIQKIFDNLDKIPEHNQKIINKMIFLILIPTLILAYQIWSK